MIYKYMSKLQLERLVGWVFLQVELKTKVISNNAFGKVHIDHYQTRERHRV